MAITKERAPLLILVIAVVVLIGTAAFDRMRQPEYFFGLPLSMMPKEVELVHHEHGKEVSEYREERAEMQHYGTTEALANGGPIYGVHGYHIVSVEYEMPLSKIGNRPVGEEDPGYLLRLLEKELSAGIPYDHFHIGYSESVADGHTDHVHEQSILIHFMFIPHALEMKLGLSCG